MNQTAKITMLGLDDAYLCADLDCKTISNVSQACPRCGSAVQSLANALSRETGKEARNG